MKTLEQYVAQFKSTSIILNPEKGDIYNGVYLNEDRQNLQTHHDLITSKYGYRDTAKEQLEKIAQKFLIHCQTAINSGFDKPQEYPTFLQEEKNLWTAKIKVFEIELKEIEAQIIKVEKVQEEQDTRVLPRRNWGTSRLRGGIVYRQAGWKVKPNRIGILSIADKRSPFDQMTLPRFKREILLPLAKETSFRQRQADKKAKKTGEPKEPIQKVKTPKFIKETGVIEYPDYTKDWVELQKQKLQK